MRKAFTRAVLAANADDTFFLTGDLGFMALEDVREAYGSRFINVGVSEQNMIGVAAGLARERLKVFAYSIAPFCYARPFEQIRNDLCLGGLPVCLVGNGGGYAYGHMGPTHHALEDCGAMNALGVAVRAPAFDDDLPALISGVDRPTYLRLGLDARPAGAASPPYAPWRRVLDGQGGVLLALGPLAGVAWRALLDMDARLRPAVWAVSELPLTQLPAEIAAAIAAGQPVYVIEEHVQAGGLGMQLAHYLMAGGVMARRFVHHHAPGHATERYGSQDFHRAQCGLDEAGIRGMVTGNEVRA